MKTTNYFINTKVMHHQMIQALQSNFLLLLFLLLFSCGKNKSIQKSNLGSNTSNLKIKLNDEIQIDSLLIEKFIKSFNKDYNSLSNKSLNNRYLADTIFGDCIFHKLNLESLYDKGSLYLLKKEILEKKVFTDDFIQTINNTNNSTIDNHILIIPIKHYDDKFESTILFKFKFFKNALKLQSVNCVG